MHGMALRQVKSSVRTADRNSPNLIKTIIPQAIEHYANTFFLLLVLLSIFNILVALFPLLLRKDNLEDIDLTQSQRALLGLDPRDAPPTTPKTQYSTPPRYPRSSTPRSQLSGTRSGSNAASPLSRKGSPLVGIQDFASPPTPTPVSLWQKVVGGSHDASGRRKSFGSPSVLGQGWKDSSILGAPSTPCPSGTAPSVALNNKWLYTKGKISPGSRMPKIYV